MSSMMSVPSAPPRHVRAPRARAYTSLLVAQLAMGSGGIFGRFALQGFGPLSVAAWRLGLAAVPLLLRLAIKRGPRPQMRQELHLLGAGLVLAAQFAAWVGSLQRLSVGASTLLVCTAPLFNGLYEVFILRRHLPRSFWLALCIALAGIGVMVLGSGDSGAPIDHAAGLGVALALLSSMGMAAYFILIQNIALGAEDRHCYDTLDIITRTFTWGALALFAAAAFSSTPLPPLSNTCAWGGVLGMAVVTQGFGHTLQNAALRTIRASIVGFATLIEPLISAVLAALLLDERLTRQAVGGGVVVLLALGWALRVTAEPPPPPPDPTLAKASRAAGPAGPHSPPRP
jgi:DME family drug/metabolite transporter